MIKFALDLVTVGLWFYIGVMTNIEIKKNIIRDFRIQYNLMWVMLILVLIERVIDAYLLM